MTHTRRRTTRSQLGMLACPFDSAFIRSTTRYCYQVRPMNEYTYSGACKKCHTSCPEHNDHRCRVYSDVGNFNIFYQCTFIESVSVTQTTVLNCIELRTDHKQYDGLEEIVNSDGTRFDYVSRAPIEKMRPLSNVFVIALRHFRRSRVINMLHKLNFLAPHTWA